MTIPPDLYLASASPRRAELLTQIGVRFTTLRVDVDESHVGDESPEEHVIRLALAKARAGLEVRGGSGPAVLGSDTVVVLGHEILGKPRDRSDGLAMLSRLSGQTQQVLTAVALVDGEHERSRLSVSRVTFRPLTEVEIEAYWETGEPSDKAGAYAVQGQAAAFIERLEGSYSGVMGLPLFETSELLNEFGLVVIGKA